MKELLQWGAIWLLAGMVFVLWWGRLFDDVGKWTIMNDKGEWLQETDPMIWTTDPNRALVVRDLRSALECSNYVGRGSKPVPWVQMVVRTD